jgi:hypothetical protein
MGTAELVHIDLGLAFDQVGLLSRFVIWWLLQAKLLKIPETVPFRLTQDIVDGFVWIISLSLKYIPLGIFVMSYSIVPSTSAPDYYYLTYAGSGCLVSKACSETAASTRSLFFEPTRFKGCRD